MKSKGKDDAIDGIRQKLEVDKNATTGDIMRRIKTEESRLEQNTRLANQFRRVLKSQNEPRNKRALPRAQKAALKSVLINTKQGRDERAQQAKQNRQNLKHLHHLLSQSKSRLPKENNENVSQIKKNKKK